MFARTGNLLCSCLFFLLATALLATSGLAVSSKVTPGRRLAGAEDKTKTAAKSWSPLATEFKADGEITSILFGEANFTVGEAKALGMKGLEGRKAGETVGMRYPKVVVTGKGRPEHEVEPKSITFLDKHCNVRKKILVGPEISTYPVLSKEYVGVEKMIGNEEEGNEQTEFRVFDTDGNEVMNRTFDEPRDFLLADNGNFFSSQLYEGGGGDYVYFYDSEGQLLKELRPFENGYFSSTGLYSPSGKYVVVSFDELSPSDGAVILFDYQGNEIWRRDLNKELNAIGNITKQVLFSPDEKHIYVAGIFDTSEVSGCYFSFCFDMSGKEEIKREGRYTGKFSPDGDYLVLFEQPEHVGKDSSDGSYEILFGEFGDQTVEVIDVETGERVWAYRQAHVLMSDADVSDGAKHVAVSMQTSSSEGKMLVFDRAGAIVCERDYKYAGPALVNMDRDGQSVLSIVGDRIQLSDLSRF